MDMRYGQRRAVRVCKHGPDAIVNITIASFTLAALHNQLSAANYFVGSINVRLLHTFYEG